jgi:multiple sugar transport system ATP-binding protein
LTDIELSNVSKVFGDGHEAVNDLTLHVRSGEFMILVGPSGCGKSTALRMIAGLEESTGGEIRIGGEVVDGLPPKDRDIAMVFQNYALYPHMTVRDNMGFALRLAGLSRAEREPKVCDAAEALDLTEHLDRRPSQLSGGQRQRVAMGRAIVRNPKAFLMDEPLSNLDAKLRVQMRAEVARIQQRLGTTTVYVTHDQTEAMTLGDRVAVMRAGVLQQLGAPIELYNEPANKFVAGFIGSPPMSFLPASFDGARLRLPIAELDLSSGCAAGLAAAAGRLVAGVRPEAFEDAALVPEATVRGVVFEAEVEVREELGSEAYAHLAIPSRNGDAPPERIVARLDSTSRLREREVAALWLDTSKVHLFDPESGERLTTLGASGRDQAPSSGTLDGSVIVSTRA